MKERPRIRSAIIRFKVRPYLVGGRWDGLNGIRDGEPDQKPSRVFLSDGWRTQMRKMIQEGYWPEIQSGPGGRQP